MLDPAYVREHVDDVRAAMRNRGLQPDAELEQIVTLETRRRRLIPELEGLKREQNASGDEVAKAKRQGLDASSIFAANKARGQQIRQLEIQLDQVEAQRASILMTLPNLPHASVPVGAGAADNAEVCRHGEPKTFDFEPKAHWDLGEALGILDFERATKITGARFAVLNAAGAQLSRAIMNFMLDEHGKRGYTEVLTPFMVNADSLRGTGNLPKFEADLFKLTDRDYYLIPTAEVPVTNLYRDEILDAASLPRWFCSYSPCFRSEAGAAGKDTRGLIRPHQFEKVELVKFALPERSWDEHEALTRDACAILEALNLHHRVVTLSTGDMGFTSAKTYDIEVWLPSQNTFREISSCSNTEAFQARRAGIKFRSAGTGKAEFAHTLNGSGLAVGRTLIAILENYQQKDGSVTIPDALRPYMDGKDRIIKPSQC